MYTPIVTFLKCTSKHPTEFTRIHEVAGVETPKVLSNSGAKCNFTLIRFDDFPPCLCGGVCPPRQGPSFEFPTRFLLGKVQSPRVPEGTESGRERGLWTNYPEKCLLLTDDDNSQFPNPGKGLRGFHFRFRLKYPTCRLVYDEL